MKWVDNGTSVLAKIEKTSETSQGLETPTQIPNANTIFRTTPEENTNSLDTQNDETHADRKLTEKEAEEINSFKHKDALAQPLMKISGAPNRFRKDTLYIMHRFKIVQKTEKGYLITPNITGDTYNGIEYDVAFLKTAKNLPSDLLIEGVVYYSGEYEYTALDGYEKSVPLLKIPANLPLLGIHEEGDPFKQEEY